MTVDARYVLAGLTAAVLSVGLAGCGSDSTSVSAAPKPEPLAIAAAKVESRPIDR